MTAGLRLSQGDSRSQTESGLTTGLRLSQGDSRYQTESG